MHQGLYDFRASGVSLIASKLQLIQVIKSLNSNGVHKDRFETMYLSKEKLKLELHSRYSVVIIVIRLTYEDK